MNLPRYLPLCFIRGNSRASGGDIVVVEWNPVSIGNTFIAPPAPVSFPASTGVVDNGDGTYTILMAGMNPGNYNSLISIIEPKGLWGTYYLDEVGG